MIGAYLTEFLWSMAAISIVLYIAGLNEELTNLELVLYVFGTSLFRWISELIAFPLSSFLAEKTVPLDFLNGFFPSYDTWEQDSSIFFCLTTGIFIFLINYFLGRKAAGFSRIKAVTVALTVAVVTNPILCFVSGIYFRDMLFQRTY